MYYSLEYYKRFSLHWEIRRFYQWVLFPVEITDDHLAFIGVYPLVYQAPEVEPHQIAEPSDVLEVDGQWVQQWTVRDRTPEEMPDPEPEEPPVDPEPEPPVQSDN